jgi:hypothetical protein
MNKHSYLVIAAALAFCSAARGEGATTPSAMVAAKERAARAFDVGAGHFRRAEYGAAARAFLMADEIMSNPQALANAIASARKASDDLLVAQAARRAIERAYVDPGLAGAARDALSDAERRLVRLEIRCEPEPCLLTLDGEVTGAGVRHLLPGTHVLAAQTPTGEIAGERLTLPAGARQRVVLYPIAAGSAASPPGTPPESGEAQPSGLATAEQGEAAREKARPLPPAAFYVGVGASVALAGVTVWSGLDALAARGRLGDAPTPEAVSDLRGRMRRTDVVLGGSLVAAAATGAIGLWLVDWGGGSKGAGVTRSARGSARPRRARASAPPRSEAQAARRGWAARVTPVVVAAPGGGWVGALGRF